jgi:uncharacterized membrane protein (DUF485 family)
MSTQAAPRKPGDGGASARDRIDWTAAERSPEFQKLIRKKRSFVLPATIFFFAWYFGFVLLAGYAEGFMGESIYEGFTVGYALALSQFAMTWILGVWYVRKANREWDPLAHRAAERARQGRGPDGGAGEPSGETSPMGISRPAPARAGDGNRDPEEANQ